MELIRQRVRKCGNTIVESREQCDDGNEQGGDGCDGCALALLCGQTFTTSWCPQMGTMDQFTKCESVGALGKRCVNPTIRYGSNDGGIPQGSGTAEQIQAAITVWCQQLGFTQWWQYELGYRECDAPLGPVVWASMFDETGAHWSEGISNGNDGYWHGPGKLFNEDKLPCGASVI